MQDWITLSRIPETAVGSIGNEENKQDMLGLKRSQTDADNRIVPTEFLVLLLRNVPRGVEGLRQNEPGMLSAERSIDARTAETARCDKA